MRKPVFCICENKGADQLRGNHAADHRLCFCYIDSIIPHFSESEINFKPLPVLCGGTAWFVLDLVGNPEDKFSRDTAHVFQTFTSYYLLKTAANTGFHIAATERCHLS